jgi:hypothetical protein
MKTPGHIEELLEKAPDGQVSQADPDTGHVMQGKSSARVV